MSPAFPFTFHCEDMGLWSVFRPDVVTPPIVPTNCVRCAVRFMQRTRSTTTVHTNGITRDQVILYRPNQHCDLCGGIRSARRGASGDMKRAAYLWLKSQPCADCGQSFVQSAMEFDHLPGHVKIGDMSSIVTRSTLEQFVDEIKKCDVVCAICHRVRETDRRMVNAETS